MLLLEKLTITDTFKHWRDKINAIINEYEGVPATDQTTGILTIDTDSTQADSFVVDIPSTFNEDVVFKDNVTIEGELNAIANSAKKLENPIQFNGILFDGSKDIITPNWGTERDILVSDYTRSNYGDLVKVNGSENYIFKMPKTFQGFLDGDAKYALNIKNKRIIDGISFDGGADVIHYAVCSTAGGVRVKEVDVPNFVLYNGASVTVRFLNTNTVVEPMLNVSKTGERLIVLRDASIDPSSISAGSTYTFVYDGSNFSVVTGVDNCVQQDISLTNREYPLLASPIRDGISKTTTALLSTGITLNPSTNAISSNGAFYTKNKFIATISNDSNAPFFVTKNSSENYTLVPDANSTYKRYVSYEDGSSHMLTALEFQKNSDKSRYSNIVVPKFNGEGVETEHSVLQVGWDKSDTKHMKFGGNVNFGGKLNVDGDITLSNNAYLNIQPYGWLKTFDRNVNENGYVREFAITADKYTSDWNSIGAGISIRSKFSEQNPGSLILKAGDGANSSTIEIHPDGRGTYSKRNSNGTVTNLITINPNSNTPTAPTFQFNGSLRATTIYNAVFNDYAEFFEKGEETEAGDIVALDVSSNEERYVKATDKSKLIVGIHSDSYGHILGGENSIEESEKTHIPVGLSGRVFVKFKGKSILGEAVVPSDTPGVGRLYDEFLDDKRKIVGYIVYDPEPSSPNERKVRVLINR